MSFSSFCLFPGSCFLVGLWFVPYVIWWYLPDRYIPFPLRFSLWCDMKKKNAREMIWWCDETKEQAKVATAPKWKRVTKGIDKLEKGKLLLHLQQDCFYWYPAAADSRTGEIEEKRLFALALASLVFLLLLTDKKKKLQIWERKKGFIPRYIVINVYTKAK